MYVSCYFTQNSEQKFCTNLLSVLAADDDGYHPFSLGIVLGDIEILHIDYRELNISICWVVGWIGIQ